MKEKKEVVMIPLSHIKADENQPRKNFDAARLASLISSIKKHGIMNPLVVERTGTNSYVLVDGERRFRSSKEIGLKEVPAIVVPSQSSAQRLIQQFHLQEQHEGWSAVEKATAMVRLAEELKVSPAELGKMLGMPDRLVSNYASFAALQSRKEFEKQETPLVYASRIAGLKTRVRVAAEKMGEDFTKDDEHSLELAVISRVKNGDIRTPRDVVKIGDAARTDFHAVMKFIKNGKTTVTKLMLESKGQVSYHLRNINAAASMMVYHTERGIPLKVQGFYEDNKRAVDQLKRAKEALEGLLAKI